MTQQLSLLDAAQHAVPYAKGSETSFEAAVAAGPRISPQKRQMLHVMRDLFHGAGYFEAGGWTQDEMSSWLILPRSTVCARFRELELEGLIEKTVETRSSRYGGKCAVYQVRFRGHVAAAAGESPASGNEHVTAYPSSPGHVDGPVEEMRVE